ncbi:hypothetical protein ACJX0J_007336 [Zea mays]
MVDEAHDESKEEEMAITLMFINKDGLIKEHFLEIIHVIDTASLTLKGSIYVALILKEEVQEVHKFFRMKISLQMLFKYETCQKYIFCEKELRQIQDNRDVIIVN